MNLSAYLRLVYYWKLAREAAIELLHNCAKEVADVPHPRGGGLRVRTVKVPSGNQRVAGVLGGPAYRGDILRVEVSQEPFTTPPPEVEDRPETWTLRLPRRIEDEHFQRALRVLREHRVNILAMPNDGEIGAEGPLYVVEGQAWQRRRLVEQLEHDALAGIPQDDRTVLHALYEPGRPPVRVQAEFTKGTNVPGNLEMLILALAQRGLRMLIPGHNIPGGVTTGLRIRRQPFTRLTGDIEPRVPITPEYLETLIEEAAAAVGFDAAIVEVVTRAPKAA